MRMPDLQPLYECILSDLICELDLAMQVLDYHIYECLTAQNAFVYFARSDPILSNTSDDFTCFALTEIPSTRPINQAQFKVILE